MIILMGAVGSGKSEQSARLAARLALPVVSTSNLLREHLTPEREAKMRAGDLVSDEEILGLIEPELKRIGADRDEFLFDGFPRSLPQAKWLCEQVKNGHIKLKATINLVVSDETVLARMLKRGRIDDQREIIMHRLDTYHKTTTPVIAYLRSHGIEVHDVDGEHAPDTVEAAIKKVLDSN